MTFGFGAGSGSSPSPQKQSQINVNVTPAAHETTPDTPEIRKYKKRFNSEILCAALWGMFQKVLNIFININSCLKTY